MECRIYVTMQSNYQSMLLLLFSSTPGTLKGLFNIVVVRERGERGGSVTRSVELKIANKMGHHIAIGDENGNCCQIIIYQASLEQEMSGRICSPQANQTITFISYNLPPNSSKSKLCAGLPSLHYFPSPVWFQQPCHWSLASPPRCLTMTKMITMVVKS